MLQPLIGEKSSLGNLEAHRHWHQGIPSEMAHSDHPALKFTLTSSVYAHRVSDNFCSDFFHKLLNKTCIKKNEERHFFWKFIPNCLVF